MPGTTELIDGVVRNVRIVSERGRTCTVENPWPGRNVQLERSGGPGETMEGERLTFPTEKGERIVLKPI